MKTTILGLNSIECCIFDFILTGLKTLKIFFKVILNKTIMRQKIQLAYNQLSFEYVIIKAIKKQQIFKYLLFYLPFLNVTIQIK